MVTYFEHSTGRLKADASNRCIFRTSTFLSNHTFDHQPLNTKRPNRRYQFVDFALRISKDILRIQRSNSRALMNDEAATTLTPVPKHLMARMGRVLQKFAGLKQDVARSRACWTSAAVTGLPRFS